MRTLIKSILSGTLGLLARLVVRKYRPKVVMITGSVGKTSTKDAIAAVLAARFYVRKSEKNFNNEFGVPFAILGVKRRPTVNPFSWITPFKNAAALLLLPNHYANMLVLEVGADQPGDLKPILGLATPDAVVVTHLPEIPVHVEAYASPEEVREEEFSPAYGLAARAPLIVSADDQHALAMSARVPARLSTYGLARGANIRIHTFSFNEEDGKVNGMRAELEVDGIKESFVVRGGVGKTQMLPLAAAVATGLAFDISPQEAKTALEKYEPPPGRSRLLEGKGGSVIIDDTYNASPAAVEEALATLKAFPRARRRVALLGDMLELGRYSVGEHERAGKLAADSCDLLISVGVRSRAVAEAARAAGMPSERTLSFDDSRIAASALSDKFGEGDVVLVKGSQSIRMERVVEILLAQSSDAVRLPRQEREWKRR